MLESRTTSGAPAVPVRGPWGDLAQSLRQPYRVPLSLVLLMMLVPLYVFIPELLPPHRWNRPASAIDAGIPLQPSWALVYGMLYLWLILLPWLVIRDEASVRRLGRAYVFVWLAAFLVFTIYPTAAMRPAHVAGSGFAAAGLRFLYDADPPYNCFPSLHVAHSFVSAFACIRAHRKLGAAAMIAATLVAFSTLFTKQHYVADVVAGVALAWLASRLFLSAVDMTDGERLRAPRFGMVLIGGILMIGAVAAASFVLSR